ncbi:neuraminidase-like domain-containing protein [Streptomyces sp. NBC_01221]|uniref:Tc toxin subunit A-related protein n=1 Tax=Streptomyces sp. NBC_01221 TaxID=2903782 RepID=UPI00224D6A32|nr:neuraminidase-like domain-containing protein [Streptomyces sp. NBC_01221]MCX4791590.1 neuraminidase-like domain-containing protein [Streptomyces sp. NBC_01221]
MHALTSLGPGDSGDGVADLHQALDALRFGDVVPAGERVARGYGQGTREAVARLQAEFGWDAATRGTLDRDSAERANDLLVERGLLQVVRGRLADADGTALARRLIFAFDVDFVGAAQLGEATTNTDGAYRIAYDPRLYTVLGPGVDRVKQRLELVVLAFDAAGATIAWSDPPRRDPGRVEEIDLVVAQPPQQPEEGPESVVRGVVRAPGGRPADGVTVRVSARGLGDRREALGEAVTAADGTFRIAYRATSIRRGEAARTGTAHAGLVFGLGTGREPLKATVFRVFDGHRTVRPLSDDDLLLGVPARPDEELEFELAGLPPEAGSEYERLMATLTPLLADRSPAVLDEDVHRDVSFAARETGADRTLLGLLVSAHRLAENAFGRRVAPELLYGLARCDQHLADLPRLTLADRDQLDSGLRQAIERAVIAPQAREVIEAAVTYLLDAAPELLRTGVTTPAYEPVLEAALPHAAAQRALLRAAAGRRDDPGALWDALRADPAFAEPGTIERAQFALQLDALTGRHLPLMTALQTEHGVTSARALLDLHPDELTGIVRRVGVPAGVPGDDEDQRAATYAAGLLGQLHLAFPTASVARAVAAAPAGAIGGAAVQEALTTVLARAGGDELRTRGVSFDIGATHLDHVLADHGDVLLDGIEDDTRRQVVPALMRTQRLYRISTGPTALGWLLTQPYGSAFDIAQLPQQTFLATSSSALDSAEAMMIHSRAQTTANAMLATYVHLVDARFGVGIAALTGGDREDRVAAAAAIDETVAKYLPAWSELFGEINWCDCDQCRSVYSPAAYLVDLLNFLDTATPNAHGQRPLDVLLTRRPDLAQTPLTCENTNTTLPYVDLVNEVLESLVVSLDPQQIPAYDIEGATAPELAAAPQHTDWAAYLTPAAPAGPRPDQAAFPHSLPFDAALSATRAHLTHLGAPRAALLETFAGATPRHALAAEQLGLAPAAFALITGVDLDGSPADSVGLDERFGWTVITPAALATGATGWWVWTLKRKLAATGAALSVGDDPAGEEFDGTVTNAVATYQTAHGLPATGTVDAATWQALAADGPSYAVSLLPHTPLLLDRAGISYEELIGLLRMRFVNPAQHAFETLQRLRLPGGDLAAFVTGGLTHPTTALVTALTEAGLTLDEFTAWAADHLAGDAWQRVRRAIVADGPADRGCGLDAVTIRHWADDTPWLDEAEWLGLDRLVRLWRALGWGLDDLDLALTALGATALTAEVVTAVARIADLAATLDLTVAEVVVLWADLDPTRAGSLFHQRLRNRALTRVDPAFDPDWRGAVLPGAVVGEHLPALRAALRVGVADLAALRAQLGLTDDTAPLDLASVSAMFRHVTLARAVGLTVRDLLSLLALTGLDPFTAPGTAPWPAGSLVQEARRIRRSDLNVAQLADVLADLGTPPADSDRDRLLAGLREGLQAITADLDAAAERDGALTRRVLPLLLVPADLIDATVRILTGGDQSSAVLAAPPAPLPVIPPQWTERLRYSTQDRVLTCTGALTDAERDTVRSFSGDAGYATAVDALHAAPRAVLQQLATALSVTGVTAPAPAALLASPLGDGPAQREADITARLRLLLDAVLPVVRDREQRTLVKQTMLTVLPDAATVALLLEGRRTAGGPVLPATDAGQPLIVDLLAPTTGVTDAARQAYELLARVRVLGEGFVLPAEDLRVLAAEVVELRSAPAHLLAFPDVRAVAAYARCRALPGQPAGRLAQLWAATSDEEAQAVLADVAGVPVESVVDLMGADGLNFGFAALRDPLGTERLIAAAGLVAALGVPAATAARWAHEPNGQATADETRWAVKARYDDAAWLEVAKALSDAQRDSRREALVAYLTPRLGLPDATGLYQQLLIDVAMGSCTMTSRIKQAISSVQLFVQRCLLNLEPSVAPRAIDAQHWQWMRNYRLWEANRKVLLYPENWILPELRDDKTPFFAELEGALLSEDLTDASAERALAGYLEQLDAVARLDVTALHVQHDFEAREKLQTVVHVFGRTANEPQTYHYRRYVVTDSGTARWTPWEQVSVDVRGDLVTAVTFNRRLFLIWAQLTTKTKDPSTKGSSAKPPQQYQEVQLCWSEYRDGAWGPKHVTDAANILTDDYTPETGPGGGTTVQGTTRPKGVIQRLETRIEGDRLRVLCVAGRAINWTDDEKMTSYEPGVILNQNSGYVVADGNQGYTYSLGTFVLDGCHGQMAADTTTDQTWRTSGLVLRVRGDALEAKPLAGKPVAAVTVLGRAAGLRLGEEHWIHGESGYFVISDARRAYFGRLRLLTSPLSFVVAEPKHSFPYLTPAPAGISAGRAVELPYLAEVRAGAEAAANSWAGASAALASAAITSPLLRTAPARGLTAGHAVVKDALTAATEIQRIGAVFAKPMQAASVSFETFFDPFACTYLKRLQQYGVPGVLTPGNQQLAVTPGFADRYRPNGRVVETPHPTDLVDFGSTEKAGVLRAGAYAVYHWELFFHIPMLISDRLRQNQRFEDALRWIHYVFNPTDGTGGYWKVLPLQTAPQESVEQWLARLDAGDDDLKRQIAEWKDHPFQPHLLARMRLPAYQKYVVMQYIDTLIMWADTLFERDTFETVNQATQLYVRAVELLGPRAQRITGGGEPAPQTFAQMRGKLDALSNVAAEFENAFPTLNSATLTPASETAGLLGIGRTLYFSVPPNDKLLGYWDTIADRLFKIRNCMNISGVVRQLPLFESPIDPALLVRATVQGIDLTSVLNEANAPMPAYRFDTVLRRAADACAALRGLGSTLLSVMERRDGEELTALHAAHETAVLKATLASRLKQEEEADAQVEALNLSRAVPAERLRYYRWLMGAEDNTPQPGEAVPMVSYAPKTQQEDGVFLIQEESNELAFSHSARDWKVRSTAMEVLAGLSFYVPSFAAHVEPFGVGAEIEFGGKNIGPALTAISRHLAGLGAEDEYDAVHAGKMASYRRRGQEYAIGANSAALELISTDKQITAAMITKSIATLERQQIEKQIAHAELVEAHLAGKYTNTELYGWMQGQISSLYFQSYQLAYNLAKQAERCYRFEHGLPSSDIIRFGAWDSLRKGLLAGERLQLQLQQLERAYADRNVRELELTKHVSLLQHAPIALIKLKETGRCEIDLPEILFDMDHPGHYQRRIKSVSLTIPAVVGPYSSVNATLTMLSNETRISPDLHGGTYERDLDNDPRFVNDFAAVRQIATSGGQNDSGLFELNFRDERYLPFEGAGAVGRWRVELDPDCNPFDLATVTDVVLHIHYTARDGGDQLRQKAKDRWKKLLADQEGLRLSRIFSLRHEFPGEWYRLQTAAEPGGDHTQRVALTRDRFPALFRNSSLTIGALDVFGVPKPGGAPSKLPTLRTPEPGEAEVSLAPGAPLPPLVHLQGTVVPVTVKSVAEQAQWRLTVAAADVDASLDQLDDLLIVCHYSAKSMPSA